MFWAARATLMDAASDGPARKAWEIFQVRRAGDRPLQLLVFNEEFLVNARHQRALITSLPFVHTARRYYRLNGLVRPLEPRQLWERGDFGENVQTWSFRGSKSRNKVSVGEPAEGSCDKISRRPVGACCEWGAKVLCCWAIDWQAAELILKPTGRSTLSPLLKDPLDARGWQINIKRIKPTKVINKTFNNGSLALATMKNAVKCET